MSAKVIESDDLFASLSFEGMGENGDHLFSFNEKEKTPPDIEVEETEDEEETLEGIKIDKAPSKESKSSSSSSIKVLAKVLSEEGVLSSFKEDTEVDGAEDLISLIQSEINNRVRAYQDGLPQEVRDLVEKYDEGVDIYSLLNTRKESLDFNKITESDFEDNDDLKKSILVRDMKERGMSDEDINEEIEDIFSLGKDDIKATKALSRIKSRLADKERKLVEDAKNREKQEREAYQNRLKSIKSSIDSTKEFAGIPLAAKVKEEAFKAMTVPVTEVDGTPINAIVKSRLEDPESFDRNMAILWTMTKGFKDFSSFTASAKKSAIRELEDAAERLAKEQHAPGVTPSIRRNSSQSETILSEIDFKNIV